MLPWALFCLVGSGWCAAAVDFGTSASGAERDADAVDDDEIKDVEVEAPTSTSFSHPTPSRKRSRKESQEAALLDVQLQSGGDGDEDEDADITEAVAAAATVPLHGRGRGARDNEPAAVTPLPRAYRLIQPPHFVPLAPGPYTHEYDDGTRLDLTSNNPADWWGDDDDDNDNDGSDVADETVSSPTSEYMLFASGRIKYTVCLQAITKLSARQIRFICAPRRRPELCCETSQSIWNASSMSVWREHTSRR